MQTPREVVSRIVRRDSPDRIGLYDFYWPDALRRWAAEGYPTDEQGNPRDATDVFGLDMCGVGGWFDALPWRGWSEVVEESEEWIVRRNGAGAALKYWKHKSGTPEHIDFRMTSREVWERDYRPHVVKLDRERVDLEGARRAYAARREQDLWVYYGHLFLFENMRQSMGDVCLYESLLLDPGWIHDYGRVYTDFFKAHFQLLIDEVGAPDGIWIFEDLGYRNGLFCSPRVLEQLIFPYYRELVDHFHAQGLPVILHSCGGIEAALPLIVEAGFDGLNPMEVKAGCDVVRFARRYGDRLCFCGGLDVRILESGDREHIRREIVSLLRAMKDTGAGYLFGSDHSVTPNVSYEDYRFALDVYREQMIY